jgi:hypothetical protein
LKQYLWKQYGIAAELDYGDMGHVMKLAELDAQRTKAIGG